MRKYIALLLTLALLLALTACGGGETPGESTTPGQSAADPGKQITESTESTETQPQEIQDTPFGDYHSEEELLAILESGDFSAYLSADPEGPADPIDTGGDEPYSGFSNSIIFTNGGDAEGVEFTDFLDELPPDVQAEFEEMQEAMTDPEMMEMFEGMEGME
ncbi:MAG: hypothetical protein IJB17_01570 [Oscillospiraceae bacterium]|nr:hypothetical protein [Oscillospiraceae bacterium]